jgi:perosamine synthetase
MDFQKGMHPLQQRRLRKLLNDLEGMIQQRRDSASALAAALEGVGLPGVKVPARCDPVFLRYPLLVKNKQAVLSAAKTARVQLGDWFLSPIHPNDSNWELAGYEPGCCPLAERICNHVINIPTGPGLTEREISRTVDFLADRAEFMTAADLR